MISNESKDVAQSETDSVGLLNSLHQHLKCLYIRQFMAENSRRHRGRYRWSTSYIEELLFLAGDDLSMEIPVTAIRSIIEKASNKTYQEAIDALKRQIRRMKDAHKMELVQDLFRAAIRAETMNRPTVFLDESYAELVTYGFALVERLDASTVHYVLAEPVAVHAVMSYLRTEGGEEYDRLMLQWLIHTQDDHEIQAMFGKAAEWFIATVRRPGNYVFVLCLTPRFLEKELMTLLCRPSIVYCVIISRVNPQISRPAGRSYLSSSERPRHRAPGKYKA